MKFLSIDSPLMQGMNKVADLMWINLLTVVCSIPVVTAGAALTAMNYMALKIVRNEEGYITKSYFKAFKENFKQATVIWILYLVAAFILLEDFYITGQMVTTYGDVVRGITVAVGVLVLFTFMFVFPLQAKFSNPIKNTLKNALFISIWKFPKTILMILLYLIPVALLFLSFALFPIFFLFGLSAPAFFAAKLYSPFFAQLEQQVIERNGQNGDETEGDKENAETGEVMEEPIFSDESDAEPVQDAQKQK